MDRIKRAIDCAIRTSYSEAVSSDGHKAIANNLCGDSKYNGSADTLVHQVPVTILLTCHLSNNG